MIRQHISASEFGTDAASAIRLEWQQDQEIGEVQLDSKHRNVRGYGRRSRRLPSGG